MRRFSRSDWLGTDDVDLLGAGEHLAQLRDVAHRLRGRLMPGR